MAAIGFPHIKCLRFLTEMIWINTLPIETCVVSLMAFLDLDVMEYLKGKPTGPMCPTIKSKLPVPISITMPGPKPAWGFMVGGNTSYFHKLQEPDDFGWRRPPLDRFALFALFRKHKFHSKGWIIFPEWFQHKLPRIPACLPSTSGRWD